MDHPESSRPEHQALTLALASQYRIERQLGRGGFATVFLAHDVRHDRPVALKVLHPDTASRLGTDWFKREIRLAARLQHPHILGVHDSGETEGQLWFTMPYVEGESLRDRLRRERQLPIEDAIRIAREAADALDYAHRHDVVHRDIKPENILLTEGHALVADFGIARAMRGDALTETGIAVGTPAYMSPEHASGGALDARTDIYALGCVLYEMLVGEPPFTGSSPQVIMARARTEDARPVRATRPTVPAALEAITAKAMSRLPADRYATAADFAHALAQAGTEMHVTTATAGVATAGAPAPRSARAAVLATGAVVVLAVTAALAYFGWLRTPTVTARTPRLAVLPFENLGAPEDDYFADGIADDVRGKLAKLPGLQVIARASAVEYKKSSGKPIQQIAKELDSEYLLTGTVRWETGEGNTRRVRVSPELIRGSDGTAQWQDSFDAELHGVFKVQADIAERVATALNMQLGSGVQQRMAMRPTSNAEAYDAYLRGEQFTQGGQFTDPAPLRKAVVYYERAATLDPSFAQAWAQLSRASCGIATTSPTPADIERCRVAADRAMALYPEAPESRLALAGYYRLGTRDLAKAQEQIERGLQVSPNHADLLAAGARIERQLGNREAALAHLEQAARIDPRSAGTFRTLAFIYHDLHRFDDAIGAVDRALAIVPANLAAVQQKVSIYLSRGDLDGARQVVLSAAERVDRQALIARFAQFQEMAWVLPDDMRAEVVKLQPEDFADDRGMWALKVGAMHRLVGNMVQAREYGIKAVAAYEVTVQRYPNDVQQQMFLSRSLALAGRCQEAIRAAEHALAVGASTPGVPADSYFQYQASRVFIQCNQPDRALELIEHIISVPGMFTPAWLRVDPSFTPLKGNPRFERLLR